MAGGVAENEGGIGATIREEGEAEMIRKLKTGEFRIYSRHADRKTGKRKNLGTFATPRRLSSMRGRFSTSSGTEERSRSGLGAALRKMLV
jgi:hypothetical protein